MNNRAAHNPAKALLPLPLNLFVKGSHFFNISLFLAEYPLESGMQSSKASLCFIYLLRGNKDKRLHSLHLYLLPQLRVKLKCTVLMTKDALEMTAERKSPDPCRFIVLVLLRKLGESYQLSPSPPPQVFTCK